MYFEQTTVVEFNHKQLKQKYTILAAAGNYLSEFSRQFVYEITLLPGHEVKKDEKKMFERKTLE